MKWLVEADISVGKIIEADNKYKARRQMRDILDAMYIPYKFKMTKICELTGKVCDECRDIHGTLAYCKLKREE
jgi:hypothetical protein